MKIELEIDEETWQQARMAINDCPFDYNKLAMFAKYGLADNKLTWGQYEKFFECGAVLMYMMTKARISEAEATEGGEAFGKDAYYLPEFVNRVKEMTAISDAAVKTELRNHAIFGLDYDAYKEARNSVAKEIGIEPMNEN